jgi:hypothetical protein
MTNFVETLQQAYNAVAEIKAIRHDDEAAHSREDALHVEALQWIAERGDEQSATLAKVALQPIEMNFGRWTA